MMRTKKKHNVLLMIIIIAILISVMIVACISLPWILIAGGMWFSPNPPKPQITYGEFPFELVYKIDDEIFKIQDTYICEYDGVGMNEGVGKYRKWKGHLKSNGEESVLLHTDDTRKIYCYIGDAEYYMNDEVFPKESPLTPHIYISKTDLNDIVLLTEEEILSYYKIEIIEWNFSEPIKNSFN